MLKTQMTTDLNNHTAASRFLSVVPLSTMAVKGAQGSKAVEFDFGERMSHLRSVREAYEERKHSSFSEDWIKTHTITQTVASISAGSRTSPDSQCKRELPRSCSDQDLFLCAMN